MYTKHFFKMLIGLIAILILGITGLFIINTYNKQEVSSGNAPAVSTFNP